MPFTRDQMAARLADDVPEGWCVNLGIGIPTMVANHVPPTREVIFQSENGVIGMGPAPAKGHEDPWLINAGKQLITLAKGASFVGHADSFAMIRGGHIDLSILGALTPHSMPAQRRAHRVRLRPVVCWERLQYQSRLVELDDHGVPSRRSHPTARQTSLSALTPA
jgi:hypothetical protein